MNNELLSMFQKMVPFYLHTHPDKLPEFPVNPDHIAIGNTIKEMYRNGTIQSIRLDNMGQVQVTLQS